MSSDLEAPASAIEPSVRDTRPLRSPWRSIRTVLKYGVVAVVLLSLYGAAFFTCISAELSDWFLLIYILGFPILFVLLASALFGRKWKEFAILLGMGVVFLLPWFGMQRPFHWLLIEGFIIHASPLDKYLSQCKLIEFVENEVKQKLGICESHGVHGAVRVVIHDTAGESALPLAQRTPEWIAAMAHFAPHMLFSQPNVQTDHLIGDFYLIDILEQHWDGSGDDF
jgi:hypothetical protein